jgi:hypothetical protein
LPGEAIRIPSQPYKPNDGRIVREKRRDMGNGGREEAGTYQGIFAGGGTISPSKAASLNSGTYVSVIFLLSVCAVLRRVSQANNLKQSKDEPTSYCQQREM